LLQEFTGHGAYVGRVVGFDGKNYRVCYEEVVNEEELDSFDITHIPSPKLKRENSGGAQAPCKKKVKRNAKQDDEAAIDAQEEGDVIKKKREKGVTKSIK